MRRGAKGGACALCRGEIRESIWWSVRLNERNVNHKKLRAFKSPTRWRTFTLITLHLSFLPSSPPLSHSCRPVGMSSGNGRKDLDPGIYSPYLPLPSLTFPRSPLICILPRRSFQLPPVTISLFAVEILGFSAYIDHLLGDALEDN